ncbi:MAG TPA: hypothetical protein VFS88_08315 [Micavibrio sp.]|nr:hypothetical protein [Micavibrio sp.]
MKQSFPYTEPTIWALRKNVRATKQDNTPATLYEHIYGYAPIKVLPGSEEIKETVRKGSAENPSLHILNSQTGFLVREIVSDDPSKA